MILFNSVKIWINLTSKNMVVIARESAWGQTCILIGKGQEGDGSRSSSKLSNTWEVDRVGS